MPLRLEIGPKDIEKSAVLVARRDTREKQSLSMENLPAQLGGLLAAIQQNLLERATAFRVEHTQSARAKASVANTFLNRKIIPDLIV